MRAFHVLGLRADRRFPIRRPPRPVRRNVDEPRINERIRKSPVRLIDADGTQVGIVPVEDARERARKQSLDLVEVGAKADPPVVKIMDWGKAKFERDKKAKEAKKNAVTIEVKEVKFRPTIDEHDFDIKVKRAERFLKKGNKVKVTVFFRYRQLRRPELGEEILDKVQEQLAEQANVDSRSRLEGRQMTMILSPESH
ncbi:MAG: translation initiation factor IF-3 [Thermoanaerobaculia bacterium]|nr:translation initiation factor IF-3 [Thermoanaerobaculia bacterium]